MRVQLDLPLGEILASVELAAPEGPRLVPVEVVRSARRRRLALLVTLDGRVEVRAPLKVPQAEILALLDQHRRWVTRKLAEHAAHPAWEVRWGAGGHWYWQGALQLLAGGRPAGLVDGLLRLPLTEHAPAAQWRRRLLDWHRTATRNWLEPQVQALFAQHHDDDVLESIDWHWMRATWGTCRSRRLPDGRRSVALRFNPWLGALPPNLALAVVLHELAHVRHMNHGARFYQRLERLDPDWRVHDRELTAWARRLFPALDAR